jgi:uncharacterized protein YodC (DUF2158 family)
MAMPSYWVRSANSPNAHLRMDASKVTASNGAGSGTVNCQFYANGSEPEATSGDDEVFHLVPISSTAFAIQSVANPNAYLRLDGSKVTAFNGAGSGTVNCQFYPTGSQPQVAAGNDEVFEIVRLAGSTAFAIRSISWPNAYLRIDGSKVTAFNGAGSGTVNCQFYAAGSQPQAVAGNDESFYISAV